MRSSGLFLTWIAMGLGCVNGCGGTSDGSLFNGNGGSGAVVSDSGGAGGSTTKTGGATGSGGTSSTGGAEPDAGSSGGDASVDTGGVANTGGVPSDGGATATGGARPGSGGAAPDSGVGCAPPASAGDTVLCVTFSPERIRARAEAKLDKMGTLILQVFDTETPGSGDTPIDQQAYPGTSGSEVSVDELPMIRFEEKLPKTVYVRAIFVDNPTAFAPGGEGWGVWLGGSDMSTGLVESPPLLPVSLAVGKANELEMALTALRRLTVTVKLDAEPIGDGEGPLLVTALRTDTPAANSPYYGYVAPGCTKATTDGVTATGFLVGSGQFYLAALLKDLGGDGAIPPGSLGSLDTQGMDPRIPTRINVPQLDYAATVAQPIGLNYVVPFSGDVPPNACKDLPP